MNKINKTIKNQDEAIRIIKWASELIEEGQEDVDYNDLATSCAELSGMARKFLVSENIKWLISEINL